MSETKHRQIHVEALKCRDCGRIGLGVDGKRITPHKCTGMWDIVIAADCDIAAPPAPETARERDRLREQRDAILAAVRPLMDKAGHFYDCYSAGTPGLDCKASCIALREAIAEAEKG